ncbi:MAG TPA: S4 domain-containing protein, partial [Coxiellaceae bacterium]|nr:S4 domain-containing protein [Coxiellaceae bacterium]
MKNIVLTIVIPPELQGKRLDAVAAQLLPDYSRTQIQTWILAGNVFINDCVIKKTRHLVTAEETIVIRAELPEKTSSTAQFIALDIIYEDDALIIINKPVGLIVHPGAGNPDQTLVNALLHHDSTLSTLPRAGIIHRLDKDT